MPNSDAVPYGSRATAGMTDYPHFSNYNTLSEAIVDFGNFARSHGLMVGTQETLSAIAASEKGIMDKPDTFRYALKAIYCCHADERETFNKLFDWFWGEELRAVKGKTTFKNQSNLRKKEKASLVMLGKGKQQEGKESANRTSGANAIDRLRKTDFSKVEDIDSAYLEELALKLWQEMSLRLKRKMKRSNNGEQLDLRSTIRSGISKGGEWVQLKFKSKKKRKERLILLLDVSGSMDRYSFFLLRFVCALSVHFEKIEAFIFSTNLIRITDQLESKNLGLVLPALSAHARNWSSGTKIGSCMKTFNEDFSKTVLNGNSSVLVLSDGLDTGEPEELAREVRRIKLRTKRLIWLNPLKGMKGYQPIQKGMSAALPEVHEFRSAHNLDSLLELENLLGDV